MNIKKFLAGIFTALLLTISCNEEKWLEEKPFDFYAPDNSYVTTAQFKQAVNLLYDNLRNMHFWSSGGGYNHTLQECSDLTFWPWLPFGVQTDQNFSVMVIPTSSRVSTVWDICYIGIGNANEILFRLQEPNQVGDADIQIFRGEALFFRAYFYRILAHLFAGVPLQLEPVTSPKRDFVRSSREEVYNRCRIDLEEASGLLPDIDKVKDGALSKQAAQHLLSEIYISLKDYPKAISAASAVINFPGMGLMTERFGSRRNEPGDVYWDLFRLNNQNRSNGNTESILVLQYDFQNAGSRYGNHTIRHFLPQLRAVQCESNTGGLVLAFTDLTAEKGGRGNGYCQPTHFMSIGIWGDDFDNDIRNSQYNVVRDFRIDNPNAKGFGEWLVADGWLLGADTFVNWYPSFMKVARVGNFPEASYARNADGSIRQTALGEHIIVNSGELAHCSFKDEYLFRLAETYLLRAEAYIGNNEKDKAAADINMVRNRANATPVNVSDVDIDFILDERGRELYAEEYRNITLSRLGKFVERSWKYSPVGYHTGEHQNLWPIPYGEIEKNILTPLEQNPGYK